MYNKVVKWFVLLYYPAKISRQNYWHLSPFQDEKKPSIKVNRNLNRWYDFAEGKSGNLVDFGIRCNSVP